MQQEILLLGVHSITERYEIKGDCGQNIRDHRLMQERYYRVKDQRTLARTAERSFSPDDALKIAGEWDEVAKIALDILQNESRDVEVLAWLTEAWLRLNGFAGLRDAYAISLITIRNHWENLHSIDDDDEQERFTPFAGLNGIGSDGTLIQPLRLAPLIPGRKYGECNLWDFQLSRRPDGEEKREWLYNAATDAGTAALSEHLETLKQCLSAFDELQAFLLEKCGAAAPPSSNIRNVLLEAIAAVRALGGHDVLEKSADESEDHINVQPADGAHVVAARPKQTVGFSNRDEAFEALSAVARYFRANEPHSPISLAIETLVRRGRMDFSELLAELLPEAQARNAVLTAAGINPNGASSDS